MPFALEALEAKKGDSLLLHYGKDANPKLIDIDGGPAGVFNGSLKPRLEAIKKERSPKLLDFFKREKQAGKKYQTVVREEGELGVQVSLLT
jgi:hypothetical protein